MNEIRDPYSEFLDSKFGFTVNDNSIFAALPRHWENEFHEDMSLLNVSFSIIYYIGMTNGIQSSRSNFNRFQFLLVDALITCICYLFNINYFRLEDFRSPCAD